MASCPELMNAIDLYLTFRIDVRPSLATNDHQVRFVADGEDIIDRYWDGMIGLDPDDILVEHCPLLSSSSRHRATVARCSCGVIGCGSVEVDIARSANDVVWTWGSVDSPQTLRFLAPNYDAAVRRA